MSHSMSSTTFFAQTPAGGVLRLVSPTQHADPRTGQQVPHQMHPTPVPWAPYQPLTPLGGMPATFDHPRTPPVSPPALIWSQSPYATIPLPRQLDVSVSMNPLLKYGSPLLLQYDITTAPGRAAPSSWATYSTASEWLREPATRPNTRTFAIRLAALGDRPVVIHAADYQTVTVYDVLAAVHYAVQIAVDSATRHYGHRSAAVQALFGGYKMWAGLTESTTEPDVWVLHVR